MDDTTADPPRIQALPSHLRPREKLRLRGPEALSEQELLAALLGSATRARPVLAVADELKWLAQLLGEVRVVSRHVAIPNQEIANARKT